ncbi:MAG: ABC transporter permease [bacterium]|nr:ABC transporter permease [bacterium]
MRFFKKYFKRHTKPYETVSWEKRLLIKLGYWVIGLIVFFVVWTVVGYLVFLKRGHQQFSGFLPVPTLKALYSLVFEGDFWSSVSASLRRVVVGITQAFIIGLPVGLLIGFYRKLRVISYPPIQFIRMISPLSWMPIALIIFAGFESAIYFLITMATVWPIILNTSLGVSRVNPAWIKMARNQGANDRQLIFRVIFPASVPYILSSLRLALGVAWIVLVPAEFLGVSSGLGYIINDARDTMEYDRLMAIVIAIGILGFILDGAIQWLQGFLNWTWVRRD